MQGTEKLMRGEALLGLTARAGQAVLTRAGQALLVVPRTVPPPLTRSRATRPQLDLAGPRLDLAGPQLPLLTCLRAMQPAQTTLRMKQVLLEVLMSCLVEVLMTLLAVLLLILTLSVTLQTQLWVSATLFRYALLLRRGFLSDADCRGSPCHSNLSESMMLMVACCPTAQRLSHSGMSPNSRPSHLALPVLN